MGAYEHYLAHHGVKGQKWGIRRYQNEDGTLTAEGRARYLNPDGSLNELGKKELGDNVKETKYSQGKAVGLGIATLGLGMMAINTARSIPLLSFGGKMMALPLTVALASGTAAVGREYLDQIGLRKAERGGVT